MTRAQPTPSELIEKICSALNAFSDYMGDTGHSYDGSYFWEQYERADNALHDLKAQLSATQVSAEKVFCAFLNNMTVDANALPIVTLDKPKIMAAIQAAMLAHAQVMPDGMTLIRQDVVNFLCGIETLDGVNFGDPLPNQKGVFWWRKYMPPIKTETVSSNATLPLQTRQQVRDEKAEELACVFDAYNSNLGKNTAAIIRNLKGT